LSNGVEEVACNNFSQNSGQSELDGSNRFAENGDFARIAAQGDFNLVFPAEVSTRF
jgi:hypothetical protein